MPYYSGHFTLAYHLPTNSSWIDMGDTKEGITLTESPEYDPIMGDSGGRTELDGVQAGGNVQLGFQFIEYDLIKPLLITNMAAGDPLLRVGRLMLNAAAPTNGASVALRLTPVANTPAAAEADFSGGKSLYGLAAVLLSPVERLLSYRLREGPAVVRLYPLGTNKAYLIQV